jgi:hypothetical protein
MSYAKSFRNVRAAQGGISGDLKSLGRSHRRPLLESDGTDSGSVSLFTGASDRRGPVPCGQAPPSSDSIVEALWSAATLRLTP